MQKLLLVLLVLPYFVKASMHFSLMYSDEKLKVKVNESRNTSDFIHDWNLRGRPGQGYYTSVLIGTPPQKLNVLVDTGSSNFAIAAAKNPSISKYFHKRSSSSYSDLGIAINVPYTQGHWKGDLGTDVVMLPNVLNANITAYVACILESDDFFINNSDWQGILGFAYRDIARPNKDISPYFDSLVASGQSADIFSLQLCGHTKKFNNDTGGVLILGGIDPTLHTGEIQYAPLSRKWYYEVLLTSIGVENETIDVECVDLNTDKTIIDSGTTNLRLPPKVLKKMIESMQSKVKLSREIPSGFWDGSKMMCWRRIDVIPWQDFPFITLSLAHSKNSSFTLRIGPQQYLRKVADIDEASVHECFKFAVDESNTGTILGAVIMEGFYVIFDRHNSKIGFASSSCAKYYLPEPPTVSSPLYFDNTLKCAYHKPNNDENGKLIIVAYIMAAICGISVIPILLMLMQWIWKNLIQARFKCSDSNSDFAFLVQ